MTNRLLRGFVTVFVFLFSTQIVSAQSQVSGEVTSLQPKEGDLLCVHLAGIANSAGTITNGRSDRAIRGRITIQVERLAANKQSELVDRSVKIELLDTGRSMGIQSSCADELPPGVYVVKVWLEWQYVNENPESGRWLSLQSPQPPFADKRDGTIIDANTHHLFVITKCDLNPDDGVGIPGRQSK